MATERLIIIIFLTCSSLLIQYSIAQTSNSNCNPSSCGPIPNISFPFRLKNDPNNCGDRRAELACENDVAVLHIKSQRFYVREINYGDFTVRLSHLHTPTDGNASICKYFSSYADEDLFRNPNPRPGYFMSFRTKPITLVSCAYPLQNPSLLIGTQLRDCVEGKYTYLLVGHFIPGVLDPMCTIESMLAASWDFKNISDVVSLSEIHESLVYGFYLFWEPYNLVCGGDIWTSRGGVRFLSPCDKVPSYLQRKWAQFMDSFGPPEGRTSSACIWFFILVVAVVFIGGVSIQAKIIIGFGVSCSIFVKKYFVGVPRDIDIFIVISFAIRFGIGFLCGMGILIYKFRRRRRSEYEEIEGFLQSDNKLIPIRYSYSDLKKMTRGFREKLGEGGFGSVYKGKLRSGYHVAVKLLGKGTTQGQDFINEIGSIGRIHHVNVVQLVGYCAEGSKRALIFDFMSNGSLEKYIFNREKTYILDCDTKFKIAIGVARGIEYLHRGCDVQILHFDIKPHNILLDDKFVPKVSDFGLAKLCSLEKDTVTMTAARGTVGYVAPELINRSIGEVSYKADVYSFGMMLIDIIGLNRKPRGSIDDSTKYFPNWIYESVNQGKDIIEIEKAMEDNGNDENESTKSLIRKMTIVALWCILMNPNDRPSMNKVLQMLEDDLERLHIPEYPSESADMIVVEEESSATGSIDSVSSLHFNKSIEITIA